jgi:ATP-dependent helicase Lhr and Lhr-like helicase
MSGQTRPRLDPRLAPIGQLFEARGWTPFAFQIEVWEAYLAGRSGVIHSATGSGKTQAAFLGPVAEALAHGGGVTSGLQVLWLTPMRALATDTRETLQAVVDALGLGWRIGLRTGDTTSAERSRQDRSPPQVLITTPESLAVMMSRPAHSDAFANLNVVIVDEWHELLGTKRGVQTELGLARLRRLRPKLRLWAMSATLGNLDDALAVLLGRADSQGQIIRGRQDKAIVLDTLIPEHVERFPWAGHLGLSMLDAVIDVIAHETTTLVFTNVRSQAEIWYQALLAARPEWAGEIALHHGSLDLETRRYVERGLKLGQLRAVVATSSLDLGVDFSPVARVLQIGSPKGVARLLQRAGRSGHAPGQVSRASCVPAHALEFIEAAAARVAAMQGRIESRRLPACPLDLLTQHLTTLATGEGFTRDILDTELRRTYTYRDLSEAEFEWCIDFITRGGALAQYPEFRKVEWIEGAYRVVVPRIARQHRLNIGTIVSEASMEVRFRNGQRLGQIEESFIAWLAKGDAFVFAGRTLELLAVEELTAYVKPATRKRATVPRWAGGKMPLSTQLADTTRELLASLRHDAKTPRIAAPELQAVARPMALQAGWSRIPALDELLVEHVRTRDGFHVFCYPFAGRHVHTALAALCAWRMGQKAAPGSARTFSLGFNDYGFELLAAEPFDFAAAVADGVFSREHLKVDVLASLNAAELGKRHFREIARVAGLVQQGYPGAPRSSKQVQATSGLIYEVFAKWDQENPLLAQTEREVLDRQLEFWRLEATLDRIETSRIMHMRPPKPTPLAFPIMLEQLREKLSTEKLADRIARMQAEFEKGV